MCVCVRVCVCVCVFGNALVSIFINGLIERGLTHINHDKKLNGSINVMSVSCLRGMWHSLRDMWANKHLTCCSVSLLYSKESEDSAVW